MSYSLDNFIYLALRLVFLVVGFQTLSLILLLYLFSIIFIFFVFFVVVVVLSSGSFSGFILHIEFLFRFMHI